MTCKHLLTAFAVLLAFAGASRAADWTESFTGGVYSPGNAFTFFNQAAQSPPPFTSTAINTQQEFLAFINTAPTFPFDTFVAGLNFGPTNNHLFSNVTATASVSGPRGNGPGTGNDVFLVVRSNGASGYLIAMDYANGAVDLVRSDAGVVSSLGASSSSTIAGFSPSASYTLQIAALGNQLFGQVRDSTGVVRAQVHGTDSTYAGGFTGIGAAVNPTNTIPIFAGFDNIGSATVVAGSSPNSPIMPSSTSAPWNFTNVPGNGRWFDPIAATGYTYQTNGPSNFTAVMLPPGPAYDADNQYVIDYGAGPVPVTGGTMFLFPTPVPYFTVNGIFAPVNGDDPLAFPTFLAFDQLTASFTQTPIPEPSTMVLAGLAVVGLVVARRRRAA